MRIPDGYGNQMDKPGDLDVVHDCIDTAIRRTGNRSLQSANFLVVDKPETRHALAKIYHKGMIVCRGSSPSARQLMTRHYVSEGFPQGTESAEYLADHVDQVPIMVIPCLETWMHEYPDRFTQATMMGYIVSAAWSFCLAAQARGLGTTWTTLHLLFEREAAELLDIPYCDVRQIALIAVVHTPEIGGPQAHGTSHAR